MNLVKNKAFALVLGCVILLAVSCQKPEGNFPGSEYMPDMGHSIAYEANVYNYYSHNTWNDESTVKLKDLSNPKEPVKGTIPRGYTAYALSQNPAEQRNAMAVLTGEAEGSIYTPINGHVEYHYPDSDEGRAAATADIVSNPFPISAQGLEQGKELYNIFCGTCHGEKADGNGYLVREDGGVYPAAPANMLLDEFINSSNGRYYHAIIYGKNVMGGYTDKISYEERWQVIHYIRSLQAKEKGLVYSAEENTFNAAYGIPAASLVVEQTVQHSDEAHYDGDHMEEEHHGEDHHEGDHHSDDHGDDHTGH